jgi:hypothetical protein
MTKKKKKTKEWDEAIDDLENYEHEDKTNSVYMFHNIKHDLHLFINADGYEDAMLKFDLCHFKDRTNWKIFLECGHQPA